MRAGAVNVGELDLAPFHGLWQRIAELDTEVEAPSELRKLGVCARVVDEAQPAGRRTYIAASGYLESAFDHEDALRTHLMCHGAGPRWPWTMMRAVFEAAFWAAWTLDPESSVERRKRGLRMEVWSLSQRTAFFGTIYSARQYKKLQAPRNAEDAETFKAEAAALGMTWKAATEAPNLVDEILNLSDLVELDKGTQRLFSSTWRALSGMQHGLPYALSITSDLETKVNIPGGALVQVSIKDDSFHALGKVTYLMLIWAAGRRINRSRPGCQVSADAWESARGSARQSAGD